MYVLSHDDNCDLKRAPKHAAMLTSHNFFVAVSLSLDCEMILTAGRRKFKKTPKCVLFHFLLSQSDVHDLDEKKV